jgi:hypothetical protein
MAARVSGRLAKISVVRGQDVATGATLLVIDNPELVTQLREAEADQTVADAELARINVSMRSEVVAQRKAEIDRATADLTLAQQIYNRTKQPGRGALCPVVEARPGHRRPDRGVKAPRPGEPGLSGGGERLHRRGTQDCRGDRSQSKMVKPSPLAYR